MKNIFLFLVFFQCWNTSNAQFTTADDFTVTTNHIVSSTGFNGSINFNFNVPVNTGDIYVINLLSQPNGCILENTWDVNSQSIKINLTSIGSTGGCTGFYCFEVVKNEFECVVSFCTQVLFCLNKDPATCVGISPQIQTPNESQEFQFRNQASAAPQDWNFSVQPNPFTSQVELRVVSTQAENYQVFLFDALGRRVFAQSYELAKGNHVLSVEPKASLTDGIYLLSIVDGNGKVRSTNLVRH